MASIIVVSPSTRKSIGTSRLLIDSQLETTVVVSAPAEPSAPSETRKASTIPATTGTCAIARSCRAPTAETIDPRSGKKGINQTFRTKKPDTSPLLDDLFSTPPFLRCNPLGAGCQPLGARHYLRRSSQGSAGCAGSMPAGVRFGYDSGPGTGSIGSVVASSSKRGTAGTPASRMSCQSVTSSDDRRL